MADSYYSDEYSYEDEPDKAQDQDSREETEPPKPVGTMEWILRGGALANSESQKGFSSSSWYFYADQYIGYFF